MSAIPASAAAENDIVVHEDDFDENGTIDAVVVSSLSRRRRHRLPRLLLKGTTPVVEVLLIKVDCFGANDVNDDVNIDENCEYNTTVFVVVIVVKAFFIVVVVVVLLLLLRASSRKISFLPNDDDMMMMMMMMMMTFLGGKSVSKKRPKNTPPREAFRSTRELLCVK